MENVAEALQIAGFMFIFIIAVSICIPMLILVKDTSTVIVENKDKAKYYSYLEYSTSTNRTVGAETIIPALYKSYTERYEIKFQNENSSEYITLYQKKNSGQVLNENSFSLYYQNIGTTSDIPKFIEAVLNAKEDVLKNYSFYQAGSVYRL